VKVRRQIQELRSRIQREAERVIHAAESDYTTLAAQEESVATALEQAKAEALDLAQRAIPYETRRRELDANKGVLNSLLARHKETDVAQELKASNIRILDAAFVPAGPVRPQRARDIAVGMLLGLAFGLGLVFFLDYMDNTLKTPDDVRQYLGAPLLGVIPALQPLASPGALLVTSANIPTPFQEGFRVIRTALSYCWPNREPRVLLCTSTAPGEGKTLTSLNLALMLGAVDGHVLLIDCDLRRPSAHTVLGLPRAPGLSEVLVGKATLAEAVRDVPGTDVKFLASGTPVPSPGDLLTTEAVRGLVDGLRGTYRFIVIDTPPVSAVADALALAAFADGLVVVAGAEMVSRKAVLTTLQRIADTGARVLGVVLNRAQITRQGYYYSRYYGHYGHYGEYAASAAATSQPPAPPPIQ